MTVRHISAAALFVAFSCLAMLAACTSSNSDDSDEYAHLLARIAALEAELAAANQPVEDSDPLAMRTPEPTPEPTGWGRSACDRAASEIDSASDDYFAKVDEFFDTGTSGYAIQQALTDSFRSAQEINQVIRDVYANDCPRHYSEMEFIDRFRVPSVAVLSAWREHHESCKRIVKLLAPDFDCGQPVPEYR